MSRQNTAEKAAHLVAANLEFFAAPHLSNSNSPHVFQNWAGALDGDLAEDISALSSGMREYLTPKFEEENAYGSVKLLAEFMKLQGVCIVTGKRKNRPVVSILNGLKRFFYRHSDAASMIVDSATPPLINNWYINAATRKEKSAHQKRLIDLSPIIRARRQNEALKKEVEVVFSQAIEGEVTDGSKLPTGRVDKILAEHALPALAEFCHLLADQLVKRGDKASDAMWPAELDHIYTGTSPAMFVRRMAKMLDGERYKSRTPSQRVAAFHKYMSFDRAAVVCKTGTGRLHALWLKLRKLFGLKPSKSEEKNVSSNRVDDLKGKASRLVETFALTCEPARPKLSAADSSGDVVEHQQVSVAAAAA